MAVAAALVIGLGLSTWLFVKERGTRQRAETAEREQASQRQQAQAQEKKARSEAAKSQQVAQFLQDMLQSVGPSVAQGRDTSMLQEILDKTAERVGNDFTNQPEVEAELMTTIGLVYSDLTLDFKAEDMLRKALALRRTLPGADLEVAVSLRNLGSVLAQMYRDPEARLVLEEALAINRKLRGNEDIEVANCLSELIDVVFQTGTRAETEAMVRQLLAMQKKLLGPDHKDLARSLEMLARLQATKGEMAEAELTQREALATYRKVLGERHPDTLNSFYNLAGILLRRGKLAEAEAVAREALAGFETVVGKSFSLQMLDGLTAILRAEGKLAEAAAMTQKRMAKIEAALDEGLASQPGRFDLLYERAYFRGRMGRWREAAADFSRIIELRPNDNRPYLFRAAALVEGGDLEAYRRLCVQIRERFGGTDAAEIASMLAWGVLLVPSSDPEDAVTGSRLADTGVKNYKGDLRLFPYQSCKALAEYRQGRFASAAEWCLKALSQPESFPQNEIRTNCRRAAARMVLAMAHYQLRQPDEARAELARGLGIADTLPKIESGDLGSFWPDWVFAQALMREAKALIEGSSKAGANKEKP
ncbi:MAG: hypothetical protein C5B50_30165 [Verrucomicrobia bacterium]|nr:MAG: hypothetical protein C5B50_30165 [Verrucomicrobiota bacterium]